MGGRGAGDDTGRGVRDAGPVGIRMTRSTSTRHLNEICYEVESPCDKEKKEILQGKYLTYHIITKFTGHQS